MSFKRKVFKIFIYLVKTGIKFVGKTGPKISSALIEELTPIVSKKTNKGTLHFFCPGRLTLDRAETLLIKEPETIKWIDGFEENSVFWDIGANVGTYSLYAGLIEKIEVLAFEPAAPNLHILNRNIEINGMDNTVFALGFAFNDVTRLDYFNMGNMEVGSALHSFSQASDWQGKSFLPEFKQGMIGFAIDEFIRMFNPSFPTHIKMDVDGKEDKIIAGGRKTFADERLKSILVELDDNQPEITGPVISTLQQAGLKVFVKQNVSVIPNPNFDSLYNYIFSRS